MAIILRNYEVMMYANYKVRNVGTFRHFSAKLGLTCQIWDFLNGTVDFVFAYILT